MKTRPSLSGVFALTFAAALPLLTGCTPDDENSGNLLVSSANAEPTVAVVPTNPPAAEPAAAATLAPAEPAPAPVAPSEVVAVPAPAQERTLPSNLKPSTPAGDVIKMAQAGVEESVMLAYITNSATLFSLTPDDIIYLNDLGVASNVVTAMMQHDQDRKNYWANQSVAANAAAAPTYVNPPPAETQAAAAPAPVAEAVPAPAANVTYNYFYDSLSPYGTWVEIEGYGRCWQPTVVVVNRGWRPYCDGGRWIYTDYGWYWMSDYSWGWAPFHYGRWFTHPRYGWCWWPDRVWGPSWVSWRYSNDYCGWAPLPPAAYYRPGFGFSYYGSSVGVSFGFGLGADFFTFVSWNNFCHSRPWHHRVPRDRATQVFNNTTIVNNYVTGNNNTVINQGIGRDRVRERTREEVRVVSIQDSQSRVGRGERGERFANDGRSLIVHRPRIPESAAPTMPTSGRARGETALRTESGKAAVAPRENIRDVPRRQGNQPAATPATPPVVARDPAKAETPRLVTPAPATGGRPTGFERSREVIREQSKRPGEPPAATPATPPAVSRAPSATPPPAASPAPGAPATREGRSPSRPPESRPENPGRDRRREGSQNATPPSIAAGRPANPPAVATPTPQNSRPSQAIVIGRRDQGNTPAAPAARVETPVSTARNTYNFAPPANRPAPAPQAAPVARPAPAPSYTPPAPVPRRETPRYTPPPQPSYSAPRPAPTYTPPAPVQRSQPSAPSAPVYRAPSPAPAPSYSPPPRSQNYESRSSGSSERERGGGRQSR